MGGRSSSTYPSMCKGLSGVPADTPTEGAPFAPNGQVPFRPMREAGESRVEFLILGLIILIQYASKNGTCFPKHRLGGCVLGGAILPPLDFESAVQGGI